MFNVHFGTIMVLDFLKESFNNNNNVVKSDFIVIIIIN